MDASFGAFGLLENAATVFDLFVVGPNQCQLVNGGIQELIAGVYTDYIQTDVFIDWDTLSVMVDTLTPRNQVLFVMAENSLGTKRYQEINLEVCFDDFLVIDTTSKSFVHGEG